MKRISLVAILACVLLPAWAWAQSGFNGTWVMDNHSLKESSPVTFLLQDGVFWCKSCDPVYHVKADGKFHKVAGQSGFDMEAIRIVNAHSVETRRKKDGKSVGQSTTTMAPDGKTARVHVKEVRQGHPVELNLIAVRKAPGPAGAHAMSGTWNVQHYGHVSKALRTMTFAIRGNVLHVSSPVDKDMSIKLDGTDTPIPGGDPGETLADTMPDPHTLHESYKKDGKLVSVTTYTLAPDGKRVSMVSRNVKDDGEFSATMIKQ